MRDVTPCLGLSLLLVLCMTACMLQEPPLPPAIPAERQPIWGDEPEMVPQVPPETLPPPGATQGTPPRLMPPPMQESPPLPEAPRKPVRLEPPAKILRDANKAALVSPQRRGFFGGRAEQRYIYQPGKVYLVISSPNHPTSLLMPPGERLAAAPIVNQCTQESESPGTETGCWVVGTTEMGSETTRQELVILRPTKAGLESTMPLFTSSGLAFYVRLRSQDEMGMIAVVVSANLLYGFGHVNLQKPGHRPAHVPWCGPCLSRPRSRDRPFYALRGGLSGAGASSTDSNITANIGRGF